MLQSRSILLLLVSLGMLQVLLFLKTGEHSVCKAVTGFVKVVAQCLPAEELQPYLKDVGAMPRSNPPAYSSPPLAPGLAHPPLVADSFGPVHLARPC